MGKLDIFECDVSGDRFGAKNDVIVFDIVRRQNNGWDTTSETICISNKELEENELYGRFALHKYTRLFVEREEVEEGVGDERIVAAEYERRKLDGMGTYKEFEERDSVMFADWDERFFEFVESEVLY